MPREAPMTENERKAEIENLYRQAFAKYGSIALWNLRPAEQPSAADALAITKALRTYGRMDGRRLAERIEHLCRAH
jgi:hypothetical protein